MNGDALVEMFREFGADIFCATASLLLVAAYYLVHLVRARRDPSYSIHYANEVARRAWIEYVMANPTKDVMAVQTLRNFIMNGILMVSTSALLIVGTLTLSGQAENITRSWHAINLGGSHAAELWIFKVMCLLAAFLLAFFSYALSIRLANHVLFMMNLPREAQQLLPALSPREVADRFNRAGKYIAIGMRAYFFAIPLVFWLFGPAYMLIATACVVALLSRLDRQQQGI